MKTPCILWSGGVGKNGYGVIKIGGRKGTLVYTHRLAFRLFNGPIPSGHVVCHRCDTPLCINPAHLFAGTDAQNHQDSVTKKRARYPVPMYGEQHPNAKLTEQQIDAIRSDLNDGATGRSVAKKYGITPQNVSMIKNRKAWKCR